MCCLMLMAIPMFPSGHSLSCERFTHDVMTEQIRLKDRAVFSGLGHARGIDSMIYSC